MSMLSTKVLRTTAHALSEKKNPLVSYCRTERCLIKPTQERVVDHPLLLNYRTPADFLWWNHSLLSEPNREKKLLGKELRLYVVQLSGNL